MIAVIPCPVIIVSGMFVGEENPQSNRFVSYPDFDISIVTPEFARIFTVLLFDISAR
jgi:hypothetical protein